MMIPPNGRKLTYPLGPADVYTTLMTSSLTTSQIKDSRLLKLINLCDCTHSVINLTDSVFFCILQRKLWYDCIE